MAKPTARKAEVDINQTQLFHETKRDLNPFWTSSLFSDVYLKNDLPKVYKHLWEDDEIGGFYDFYNGFIDLCTDLKDEAFSSWREADTVRNWIVPVMTLLGWENQSERHQNSFIDNTSFTVDDNGRKQVYRPDLIYFDHPSHKAYTQKEKKSEDKLREIKNKKFGAKIVVEAKYWNRLSHSKDKFKVKEVDDSASSLGPELQTLKYMDLFSLDFGILTDGKTWKLLNREMSGGLEKRCYEFDLGNLKELAEDLLSGSNEDKYRSYAKYFYYFFSKPALVISGNKTVPLVYEVLNYSKKYAHSIENDLRKRFIITMGITCNALYKSAKENGEVPNLELLRNVSESHIFNILFVKSCEVRRILPVNSLNYLKCSIHEVIESLTEMGFDPSKNWDDYLRDFRFGSTFGGQDFSYDSFELYDRFINLYEIIHDGTNSKKDFGFEISGFKESIFSKSEWKFAKTNKIKNRDMLNILFNLNFIESSFSGRKYQQIPYSYFSPRQLGSIYESFLEYQLEKADNDMVFSKEKWSAANLKSTQVKGLKLTDSHIVKKGELYFSPNNKDRKMTGSFYTPDYVVKHLIGSALDELVKNKRSEEILKVHVCDPAMGSGHFLTGAMEYLATVYRQKWCEENNDDIEESFIQTSRKILDACLLGVDFNPRAVKLAKMSLWLLTALPGVKLERLDDQLKHGDSLVDNFKGYGQNFNWNKEFKGKKIDAFIGNPPWITFSGKEKVDQMYGDEYKAYLKDSFPNSNGYKLNSYSMFIERCMQVSGGETILGLVIPKTVLDNQYNSDIRNLILTKYNYIEVSILPVDVFEGVTAESICLVLANTKVAVNKNKVHVKDLVDYQFKITNEYGIEEVLSSPDKVFQVTKQSAEVQGIQSIIDNGLTVENLFKVYVGVVTGDNKKFLSKEKKSKDYKPILKGSDLKRCSYKWLGTHVLWKPTELHSNTDVTAYDVDKKILVRKTGSEIICCVDFDRMFTEQTVYNLIPLKPMTDDAIKFYSVLLNSNLIQKVYSELFITNAKAFPYIKGIHLKTFPLIEFDKNNEDHMKILGIYKYPERLKEMDETITSLFLKSGSKKRKAS